MNLTVYGGKSFSGFSKADRRNSSYDSFFTFGEMVVEDLKAEHRCGTARHYKGILSVLRTFTRGKDLKFNVLTYDFLKRFERQHLARGNSWNGLSTYLRGIRALYNKGIKAGLIEKEAYPFAYYSIRQIPTEKRALSAADLRKILELEISQDQVIALSELFYLFLLSVRDEFYRYGFPES
ncbi:phage integrase SAM-like domain-containing protein [Robiginitalea sp.]|uniref:phage integrase SAM-like domain-containing protein n=1 Tax=Robiginitalea sp. TaxID=1902411 RepID=UPI003C47AAA0